jgi:hypothetical protein
MLEAKSDDIIKHTMGDMEGSWKCTLPPAQSLGTTPRSDCDAQARHGWYLLSFDTRDHVRTRMPTAYWGERTSLCGSGTHAAEHTEHMERRSCGFAVLFPSSACCSAAAATDAFGVAVVQLPQERKFTRVDASCE